MRSVGDKEKAINYCRNMQNVWVEKEETEGNHKTSGKKCVNSGINTSTDTHTTPELLNLEVLFLIKNIFRN